MFAYITDIFLNGVVENVLLYFALLEVVQGKLMVVLN